MRWRMNDRKYTDKEKVKEIKEYVYTMLNKMTEYEKSLYTVPYIELTRFFQQYELAKELKALIERLEK
jgi:hypothetical protein